MNADLYTLILTQGVHVVRSEVAQAIRIAIESGERLVDVDIDLFGGPNSSRRTSIVTAHVVALVEAKQSTHDVVAASGGKVRTIR
ncbi:MAG: hypothetical protein JWO85_3130 [Candidatus Eremiobacteraeota bacterium]|nr:hypothetical protein [Candidatus Eremiobacteraeota bacterium]